MKATVMNVMHVTGIANKTGKPFELHRISVVVKGENTGSEKFSKTCGGIEISELDLKPTLFDKLLSLQYPCVLDLTIEQVIHSRGIDNIVGDAKLSKDRPFAEFAVPTVESAA